MILILLQLLYYKYTPSFMRKEGGSSAVKENLKLIAQRVLGDCNPFFFNKSTRHLAFHPKDIGPNSFPIEPHQNSLFVRSLYLIFFYSSIKILGLC